MEKLRINELPDEWILKIFSSFPMFEASLARKLISKAWEHPWKLESDVTFDGDDKSDESFMTFISFVYGSLLFNNAQPLDRFQLKLRRNHSASDINFWVKVAVYRSVRMLRINMRGETLELPSCLSTCTTLKSLILRDLSIDTVPPLFSLPSLKSLHLLSVKFSGKASVARLLKRCPELEYLVINPKNDYNAMLFNTVVNLPLLKSLHLFSVKFSNEESLTNLLRSCPRLEDLVINRNKYVNEVIFNTDDEFSLPSLKSLHLFSVSFSGEDSVASPRLEYLVIDQTNEYNVMTFNTALSLPLLKSLHLFSVKFSGEESVTNLLRSCPRLESLVIDQTNEYNVMTFNTALSLPLLKSLHLFSVKFLGEESVTNLLQSCPRLESLVMNRTIRDDKLGIINIDTPSLTSLSINSSIKRRAYTEEIHGFRINAPALMILNIKDTFSNFLMFEYMPEVIKADIEVISEQSEKFIGSFTSIQHLSLCSSTSKTPYPRGTFFFFLEHLELCTCSAGWWDLLTCILNDAPRLQSLKLKSVCAHNNDPMNTWSEPTVAPERLLKHLEILEWRQYEGTEQEMDVAAYMLANATCLKRATFSTRCGNEHNSMLNKLETLNIVSETCQLVLE